MAELERTDDWLSFLPSQEDLVADRLIAEKLANCIARVPGDREDKIRFFLANYDNMANYIEAEKGIDPFKQPKRFGAAMRAAAFAYWRRHYQSRGREQPQMSRNGR